MSKYIQPLIIFVGGQLLILVMWLFLPSIGAAGETLATTDNISLFWGMSWAAGSVKLIVLVMVELITIIGTLVVYVRSKN